jgi:importin subunit beta-1
MAMEITQARREGGAKRHAPAACMHGANPDHACKRTTPAPPPPPPQVLISAQHQDTSVRTAAEEQLRQFQEQNFPGFLASLSAELASAAKPPDSRRLAGLILKNALDAKDDVRKRALHQRWTALDPALQQHVRDAALATLRSDVPEVRHTAAMVVAKIAAIDLPLKTWPALIQALLHNTSAQPCDPGARQASLDAMGLVCEEMSQLKEEVLTPQEVNMILTAVVAGMAATEPDSMRLAGISALCNCIEFAEHNFENENERNVLMQVGPTICSERRVLGAVARVPG